MEKFRVYSDPQTGINLFVPAYVNNRLTILQFFQHLILGGLLLLIRLPLLIVLILLFISLNSLKICVLNKTIGKLLLLNLGFYTIDNQIPIQDKQGQLILSNHSSPIDWIFFLAQSNPDFIEFVKDSTKELSIKYRLISFTQIIKNLFSINIAQNGVGISLDSIISKDKSTLLFFEGCQTNQLGIMAPQQQLITDLQNLQQPIVKHLFSQNIYILTYQNRSIFTPINTTRNGYWHFILLLTNFSNHLRVVCQEFQNSKDYQKLIYNFYECEGLKIVNSNNISQEEFLDYYKKTSKGNYIKQE